MQLETELKYHYTSPPHQDCPPFKVQYYDIVYTRTKGLKGNCTPDQKLACFVLSLKIINTFFEKIIYASYSKLSKELKNSIGI